MKKILTLTVDELKTINNLLFRGSFGYSLDQSNMAITPLINKISKMIDVLAKPVEVPGTKDEKTKK